MLPNSNTNPDLLQSPLWAQVQKSASRSVFYLGSSDSCHPERSAAESKDPSRSIKKSSVNPILIIKHSLPFGKSWFYSPRLDCIVDEFPKVIDEVATLAKKENTIFWKIELNNSSFKIKNLELKIKNSPPLQYPETFIIDLSQSEDELLKNMKQKTRYNIRLAQKRGVKVKWSKDTQAFNTFYNLLSQTATRQKIGLHSKKHYQNILKILGDKDAAAIVTAYYNGNAIAANLITFYNDTATYLHGGTSDEHKNLMAPYLLQWKSMLEAKRRGMKFYDLGGCAISTGKTDSWAGITRFKSGFGGELHQFGETFDVVFDGIWYKLYKLRQKFKS